MTCALVETISVCKRRDEEGISTICPKHKTSELHKHKHNTALPPAL